MLDRVEECKVLTRNFVLRIRKSGDSTAKFLVLLRNLDASLYDYEGVSEVFLKTRIPKLSRALTRFVRR